MEVKSLWMPSKLAINILLIKELTARKLWKKTVCPLQQLGRVYHGIALSVTHFSQANAAPSVKSTQFTFYHTLHSHQASYPMGIRGSFPGGKAAGAWRGSLTSIQYRGQRMRGAIPPLPQYAIMAWWSVEKHRDNFTFSFILCIHRLESGTHFG